MKQITILLIITLISNILLAQSNNYLRAKIEVENKNYDNANKLLTNFHAKYPNNQAATFLQAQIDLELKNYKQAIINLDKLKSNYNSDILLMRARANAGLSKNEIAISQLDNYLLSRNKQAEPIIESFKEFQLLKTSNEWKALWENERYTKKERLLSNILFAIKSKRYSEANDRLDEFLAKYKTNAQANYLKSTLLSSEQKYREALKHSELAVKHNDKILEYKIQKAICLTKAKKTKKALELYNQIIKADSLCLEAYLGRAEAFMNDKKTEKAENDILKYREYYPYDKSAQLLNAQINTKSGDFLGAISNYGSLIKSDPSVSDYFIGRADAYLKTNTYKYAIYDYSMALDLDPKNVYIYKQKALAHKLLGELSKACTEWKNAVRLGDISSLDNLRKYCK